MVRGRLDDDDTRRSRTLTSFQNWTRSCEPGAAQVLRNFFDAAGAEVRARDAWTLIAAGFTGGDQCGTQGDEYPFVSASSYVDVVQYHDYGADGVPLPGDQWNGLARRLEQAAALGKPLLWTFVPDPRPADCTYGLRPPTRDVVGQFGSWGSGTAPDDT